MAPSGLLRPSPHIHHCIYMHRHVGGCHRNGFADKTVENKKKRFK